jgi:hypothetical protein
MNKKEETIKTVKKIISEYTIRLTLRQIFYRLVSKHKMENTTNEYKYLSRILVDARYDGLIPFTAIEDRTRAPRGGDDYLKSPEEHFNLYQKAFKNAHLHYRLPRWLNQEKYVEVWLEKEALSGLFEQETEQQNVVLATCRGYPSLTFLYEAVERLELVEDQDITILYFGDFDPSGKDIYRYIQETFGNFDISADYEFIAITREQIDKYNIPPMPTKKTDARAANFIAEHGDLAVELDAIEPDVLQSIVRDAIFAQFDGRTFEDVQNDQEDDREKIRHLIKTVLKED